MMQTTDKENLPLMQRLHSKTLVTSAEGKIWRIDIESKKTAEIPFLANVRQDLGPLLLSQKRLPDGPVEVRAISAPRISPDGQKVVFSALGKAWIMNLDSDNPRRLTKDESPTSVERFPDWSPDGKYVVYTSWSPEMGGHILKIKAGIGLESELLSKVPANYVLATFTPDGARIVAAREGGSSEEGTISTYDLLSLDPKSGLTEYLTTISASPSADAAGDAPFLHFVNGSNRVYFTEFGTGFASIDLSTKGRCNHFEIDGNVDGLEYSRDGVTGFEFVPNRSASQGLLRLGQHVYKLDMSDIDLTKCEGAVLKLSKIESNVRAERLSKLGGRYPSWSSDEQSVYYSLGARIFRSSQSSVFATAGAHSALDIEAADELDEVTVNLELDRYVPEGTVALLNARIITMVGDEIIPKGDIVVRRNRIYSIGASGDVAIPDDAKRIDLAGATILPGFIDTHCHARGLRRAQAAKEYQSWEMANFLAYGVTTCADPFASQKVMEVADRISAGEVVGSRLLVSGQGIMWNEIVRTPEEADGPLERDQRIHKTNWSKYYLVGSRLQQQWFAESAAQRNQTIVSEGLEFDFDLSNILDGIGGMAHSIATQYLYDDVRQLVAKSGTVLHMQPAYVGWNRGGANPFSYYLQTYDKDILSDEKARRFWITPRLLELLRTNLALPLEEQNPTFVSDQIRRFIDAGGTVALGEHGEFLGIGYHWGVWTFAQGMSNHLALRAATQMGAVAIGYADDLGTLESGKIADMLILANDPLEDIQHTRRIKYVMKGGQLFNGDTLDEVWPDENAMPRGWWTRVRPEFGEGKKSIGGMR